MKKMSIRHSVIAMAILSPMLLVANEATSSEQKVTQLGQTTVSATRIEQDVNDVASTVVVIDEAQMEMQGTNDIKDLTRYEADTSVRFTPNRGSTAFYANGRGGNEGINIRGLEGNQVLLQTDGVRLPMSYGSGPFFSGRGDYIDTDGYKSVEILKGPASSMYGSDGLAGAVSFMTKDPEDLLTLGNSYQTSVKMGYFSADESYSVVPTFAARVGDFEGMLLGSFKRGHETDTKGENESSNVTRTKNNPTDTESNYLLGKLIYKVDSHNKLKLTAESLEREYDTDLVSLIGDSMYPTTTDSTTTGDISRKMVKLDYEYDNARNAMFQKARASIYKQDSENSQFGEEIRTNTTGWNYRWRDNTFYDETIGGSLLLESNFGSTIENRLIYGADVTMADVRVMNDGQNILNGTAVTSGSSGFVAKKNFPDTDYDTYGIFVQDEMSYGKLSVIPGLRFDGFKLTPHADSLYQVNNTVAPTILSDSELSPKFGIIWKEAPLLNAYAQYAHGFRAPTPWNVNGGTSNLSAASPYMSTGNPSLKPETSDSYEIGLRGNDKTFTYNIAGFYSTYNDFIASNQKVSGSGTVADPTVYQSVNLNDVKIHGYEINGAWNVTDMWKLSTSYARTWGSTTTDGVKSDLYTIEPAKWINGLHYNDGQLAAQLMYTHLDERENATVTNVSTAKYDIVDIMGTYAFSKNLFFSAGIYNLFDSKYFNWADVRDASKTSSVLDVYSQPGRNFTASLKVQF